MKKLLLFILVVALLFVGCQNNRTEPEPEETESPEPTTVVDNEPSPAPPEEEEALYHSEVIIVGADTEWALEGILTMPLEASAENPVPAVILVHGSGPQDMDSTIVENRPFFDIADYLSAHGIAVIRYDKRTLVHGASMVETLGGGLTVWEETIEDAILAAEIARNDPRIDENRIFLLGHSLGGMLAPRIYHADEGGFAGLILFAGSPRLLTDIILEQNNMVLEALEEGPERELVQAQIDALAEQIAGLSEMTAEEAQGMSFLGASAYYFTDLAAHPFADDVETVTVPILIMQGENDLQVLADVDFAILIELLGDRENVTLKLYEGLNHLFMPSFATTILEIGEEYAVLAHVDTQVLRDLVEWILGQA